MKLQQSESRAHYLLEAEEQILRSIAARAAVPEILNEICSALDRQIGNMVSLISATEDDVTNTADIARNAMLFGLHIFSSTGIFGECGEELGSLEVYSCSVRDPSAYEVKLIARAACLAAIVMERHAKSGYHTDDCIPEKGRWGSRTQKPISMN
jgi:hypothetical protein